MAFKVLVLDDSPTTLRMTQALLGHGGFEVVTLDSPALFFKTMNREKPDVVLVDVAMPVVDGGAVVEMSRKMHVHNCPVLLYSDRTEAELEKLSNQHGADGFVRKTKDGNALKTAILTALVKGKRK